MDTSQNQNIIINNKCSDAGLANDIIQSLAILVCLIGVGVFIAGLIIYMKNKENVNRKIFAKKIMLFSSFVFIFTLGIIFGNVLGDYSECSF